MRAGDVVVDGTETFKILSSAAEEGRCHMELVLGPGAEGPPLHTHEELEEAEVIEGRITFWLDGVERTYGPGEKIIIPPGCAHTFKNPSRTEPVRALGTHGGRFERLIDQMAAGNPRFLRLCLYLATIDPRASYMTSPIVRAFMRTLAFVAKIRGVTIAKPTGQYGSAS